jgi:hypothetical protein
MNFDTLNVETPCIEGDLYGTAEIKLDRNGRPVGMTSLDEWIDKLDIKLIEHYGESIRPKLNHARAERGQKPL